MKNNYNVLLAVFTRNMGNIGAFYITSPFSILPITEEQTRFYNVLTLNMSCAGLNLDSLSKKTKRKYNRSPY